MEQTGRGESRLWRVRWAAIGAAIAVALGGGGVFIADAVSGPSSSVVTISPVRILDTRDPVNLGLPGPFVSAVSQKLQVTGSAVPAGATGVLLNVTVVAPSAAGFVSIRPGDSSGAPSTSSLNVAAHETVPNAVQVALPTDGANVGQIDITYDAYGVSGPTADVLVDVVGYLVAGAGGATGPTGPAGPPGLSAWQTIPSGVTVRGEQAFDGHEGTFILFDEIVVELPGVAPVALDPAHVNLSVASGSVDGDATCTGTVALPTAPPGKVCVYRASSDGVDLTTLSGSVGFLPTYGFVVRWRPIGSDNADEYVKFTWAYTAP